MAKHFVLWITVLIAVGVPLLPTTEALSIGDIFSAIGNGIIYVISSFLNSIREFFFPPMNTNSSIQYLLYTPEHPTEACYLETNEKALERCPFNPSHPLKVLVHGFLTTLDPGNQFEMIKDNMLANFMYNVIIVNWTKYNQPPYTLAASNTQKIGEDVAKLLKYLEDNKGVAPKNIHIIGHSLGAHISGVAGTQLPSLGRITGLDPASRLVFPNSLYHRLNYTDATFVDIIHTSTFDNGFGSKGPNGDLDFYPNGGETQPRCSTEELNMDNQSDSDVLSMRVCNHNSAVVYFLQSVNATDCHFLATKCDSYDDFLNGLCPPQSTIISEMGLQAKMIPELPPKSKFYLRISANPPYCLQDGYMPS